MTTATTQRIARDQLQDAAVPRISNRRTEAAGSKAARCWSGALDGQRRPGWCAAIILGLVLCGSARAEAVRPSGDYGYRDFVARGLDPAALVDARGAKFRVANSKNTHPTADADCENGPLPTNPYPLRIYESPAAVIIGGRFDGDVPLAADWVHTYCNSAAVGVWDSPSATVEGIRARRVWDAIRFSGESPFFKLEDVWLSEVRDDCVENDGLRSGLIKDVLFDGCFVGISVRFSGDGSPDGSGETVTLAGVLMRLQPYLYRGEIKHGSLIKADEQSPRFQVYDSVFAMTGEDVVSWSQLTFGWDKISDCRNNVLLWLSDLPWPGEHVEPPSCFRIVRSEQARSLWESIRQNWIDCHLSVARFSDDTVADPLECDRSFYGGQY